ncbi:sulfotransferase family protein [Agrobacterium rosae]|uniref:sulfotransferase family protein n=1 Tax=Agrobacterium rosae TaxID=1972867 RepID=UPI00122F56CA|nr:sulfotransferase family protein [Agrobacterium rosae]KAA3507677.1 hypothetical protein DXM21_24470 [Agrobacterium rosae]KAA3512557.1 hypothetical protein DXM25_24660 [Agrobacterium rosae]MQB51262.1 hypothetical protein [Agrobacterium rosae]
MKIFGVGLNKTGTSTLGACFQRLGYKHLSVRRDLLQAYREGRLNDVFSEIDQYETFEDWPYPLMYRELEERYGPDAKFVLTVRKSPQTWLRSLERHSMYSKPHRHSRKLAYGFNYPHYSRKHHVDFYERHYREVHEYFSAKNASNRLLLMCWENGDGWEKLCSFLEMPLPAEPVPMSNVSAERPPSGNEQANRLLMLVYGAVSVFPGSRRFI